MTWTMLLHAQHHWPQVVVFNLWPYATCMACDMLNHTPQSSRDKLVPLEAFARVKVSSNPKHWHHFACPAYILQQDLQGSTSIFHKWKSRARLGLYLGQSPMHSKDIVLVLSLETGLVSPQFHVKLDSSFKSLKETESLPPSQ